MKRDMDLVREVLLAIEAEPKEEVLEICPDKDQYAVGHHLILLAEAGFIRFEASRSTTNPDRLIVVYPFGLTWAGHEFLNTIRDPEIWARTKEGALAAGGFSLDLLSALAIGFAKKQISEKTGIEL
ncbi:MAG: hypothetical protein DHS20C03_31890 [Minwuia thermotolerans]|nr:MAG: hypothetical protein DHS20C03_31890 [Minwuia thermotolerans]